MTDSDYAKTQNLLMVQAALVGRLDLVGFLERIEEAEAVGPLVDPTLYRVVGARLAAIRDLARAAQAMQAAATRYDELGAHDTRAEVEA